MKKIFTLTVLSAFIAVGANAQSSSSDGINSLFKGSPGDINKLLNAYTAPLFKGLGNGLNGGWANTAKTQKLLRFNIRVSLSASQVPDADKNFDIAALGLANIKPTNASQTISPTFGGSSAGLFSFGSNGTSNTPGQAITITDPAHPNDPNYQYKANLPDGVSQYIPAPQVELTVGLIKNTDATLRFAPDHTYGDAGTLGLFGIGVKHNFAPELSKTLPFDLALAVGYTHLSYNKPLNVKPDANNGGVNGNTDFSNQSLQGDFSGWNAQVILSKRLLFFTPFVSLGYLSSSTSVNLNGNYPFVTGVATTGTANNGKPVYTSYANPISISGSGVAVSGPQATVGAQLSFFVLKIFGSYSFAQYQSANLGFGLGF